MATLLNIKPILTAREGKLDLLERVRTRRKAWARVIDLTAQAMGDRPPARMAIVHVNVPERAQAFLDQVREELPCPDDVIVADFTAGLSVHAGAGMIGVVAVADAAP
jgi:fatty acid-binding protein DegV